MIAPGLAVLFVGINPGLYSGAVGHHFARPGSRFWSALHNAGFTPRLLRPDEDGELLAWGLCITNLVSVRLILGFKKRSWARRRLDGQRRAWKDLTISTICSL